eukprot:3324739-Rhodomonas_salina.1
MCEGPGFDMNLEHWFTANARSGRVKVAKTFNQACGMEVSPTQRDECLLPSALRQVLLPSSRIAPTHLSRIVPGT